MSEITFTHSLCLLVLFVILLIYIVEGKICYIAGWGTQKLKGPPTRILYEAALPLVSHEQCNAPRSYSGVITGDMICAGYKQGGVDTCEGDSGGKLLNFDRRYYRLHAIKDDSREQATTSRNCAVDRLVARHGPVSNVVLVWC